tara:strand:+ start:370 stop:501 length:132 start_codon:yes stop_codon:yes gene_type:complete
MQVRAQVGQFGEFDGIYALEDLAITGHGAAANEEIDIVAEGLA